MLTLSQLVSPKHLSADCGSGAHRVRVANSEVGIRKRRAMTRASKMRNTGRLKGMAKSAQAVTKKINQRFLRLPTSHGGVCLSHSYSPCLSSCPSPYFSLLVLGLPTSA